jgi:hypothetical protein
MIRALIILLLISKFCLSQEKIQDYNGIWIAEDYYHSFEKTKNCLESKYAFDPNEPVGLRINTSEIKNGILNIGFSCLHDHLLRPEVSEYIINGKDTIREQGYFKIKLSEQYDLNKFPTTEILFFSRNWKSSLILNKNSITLYRPENKDFKARKIKFIKIKETFDHNYQYPNPLYFYTRKTLLEGNYTLKDSTNKVITQALKISANGEIKGYAEFENKKIYYSTDIYCGPPAIDEFVLICNNIEDYHSDCKGFVFKRINENTIYLYNRYPRRTEYPKTESDTRAEPLGAVYYKLIKH